MVFTWGYTLAKDSRIETLIGLIALSYSWMLITGLMIKKKIRNFHLQSAWKAIKSVFKAGLEFIMRALYTNNSRDFARAIKFLSCTYFVISKEKITHFKYII
ncbi:MAG: hypothetical protein IPO26_04335 [Saprospiraceae bacterium]|nr:hypothetical protein [Saprospiraceae bacterium]